MASQTEAKSDIPYYTMDIGVNFAGKHYTKDSVSQILYDSYQGGVDAAISISNSAKETITNIELVSKNKNLYFTAGCHPHSADNFTTADLKIIEEAIQNPKCLAVGECGLDYNRNFSSIENQKKAFTLQILLAKKYNKKLYLHCRDAYEDFIAILKAHNYYNGIVHCFTGTFEQAKQFIDLGFRIGVTGWLLDKRRNSELVHAIINIDIKHIFVETDAPWLAIRPKKHSEPIDTRDVVKEIAKLKKMSENYVGQQIYFNTLEYFGLL